MSNDENVFKVAKVKVHIRWQDSLSNWYIVGLLLQVLAAFYVLAGQGGRNLALYIVGSFCFVCKIFVFKGMNCSGGTSTISPS